MNAPHTSHTPLSLGPCDHAPPSTAKKSRVSRPVNTLVHSAETSVQYRPPSTAFSNPSTTTQTSSSIRATLYLLPGLSATIVAFPQDLSGWKTEAKELVFRCDDEEHFVRAGGFGDIGPRTLGSWRTLKGRVGDGPGEFKLIALIDGSGGGTIKTGKRQSNSASSLTCDLTYPLAQVEGNLALYEVGQLRTIWVVVGGHCEPTGRETSISFFEIVGTPLVGLRKVEGGR